MGDEEEGERDGGGSRDWERVTQNWYIWLELASEKRIFLRWTKTVTCWPAADRKGGCLFPLSKITYFLIELDPV